MNVTFHGAAREVTGSMHLLTTDQDRILLDCGMFQGRRKESEEKNRVLPFDPGILTNIVLSHAHIDHSGRIPMVTRRNFHGRVYCTRVTRDACEYLLSDSAKIQESDADYLNYKTVRALLHKLSTSKSNRHVPKAEVRRIRKLLKKNRHELNGDTINRLMSKYRLNRVEPLYTIEDAEDAIEFFRGFPYEHPVDIGQGVTCTFHEAGHILGSSFIKIGIEGNGRRRNVLFTGDIGRFNKPILKDPTTQFSEQDRDVDLLIMESTYGNRFHDPVQSLKPRLKEILAQAADEGGSILIPAFAYGRTQELIYVLHEIYNEGDVPRLPIYLDSPLATKITRVFAEHPEAYDKEAHATFLEQGQNPFQFDQITFTESVEDSMALMREKRPHIVIAASGMCEGGRILHHLRYKVHDPRNTILIVGYMAANTLGRRILEQGRDYEADGRKGDPPLLRFYNKEYPLKAKVVELGGFSAHADRDEMLKFLKASQLRIKKAAVVHGEEDQALSFAETLREEGIEAVVPRAGESVSFG